MREVYRRRLLTGLIVLLLLFGIILLVALLQLNRGIPLIGTGLPYGAENFLIMVLSFLALVKVIVEIIKVEHQ